MVFPSDSEYERWERKERDKRKGRIKYENEWKRGNDQDTKESGRQSGWEKREKKFWRKNARLQIVAVHVSVESSHYGAHMSKYDIKNYTIADK